MLKLYHFWSSTCSRKVRLTLAEKKIDWVSHHIDIVSKLENLEPNYVKINPNGVVPTLEHDGKIIIESNVIIEYLDDVFRENSLRPKNSYQCALMRLWLDLAETKIHKNINIISYNKRHVPRANQLFSKEEQLSNIERFPEIEKRAVMLKRFKNGVSKDDEKLATDCLVEAMDQMERTLVNSEWLAGTEFSLADIAIAPFIERFEANGIETLVDWGKRPKTGNWWKRVQGRPSFIEAYSFQDPNK